MTGRLESDRQRSDRSNGRGSGGPRPSADIRRLWARLDRATGLRRGVQPDPQSEGGAPGGSSPGVDRGLGPVPHSALGNYRGTRKFLPAAGYFGLDGNYELGEFGVVGQHHN